MQEGLEIINNTERDISLMFMTSAGTLRTQRGIPDILIVPANTSTKAAAPLLRNGSSLIICTSEKAEVYLKLLNVRLLWINAESDVPDLFPLETYSIGFPNRNTVSVTVDWKRDCLSGGAINMHMLVHSSDDSDIDVGEKSVTIEDKRPKEED